MSESEVDSPVDELDSDVAAIATDTPSGGRVEPQRTGRNQTVWYRIHPLGVVICGLLVASVVATVVGTDYLIGNLAWWHWLGLLVLLVLSVRPTAMHAFRVGLEKITSVTAECGKHLGWVVFFVSLFNVVTRYVGRYIEADIIIGEMRSVAWMTFSLMFLICLNYGVREGVNPRIDFWWHAWSNRTKAWLDFVMHVFFLHALHPRCHPDPLGLRPEGPRHEAHRGLARWLACLELLGEGVGCRVAADRTHQVLDLCRLRTLRTPGPGRDHQDRVRDHRP